MDTAGMIRPKTVNGATTNLAAYLVNNHTSNDPMVQAHWGALESLVILGDKVTPRKEKTMHHGSESKHRSSSKDACDEITHSKIDNSPSTCCKRRI
jgi:hypothetical protein